MPPSPTAPVTSLYVHVPFCARKCQYCAFYSEAADGETIARYVAALTREMERVAPRLRPRTVFFGGGTPSLLSVVQWEQVFQAMDRLGLLGAVEWTVECNPATVSEAKARLLRDHGVNRLSLGVQSLDEALLDRLGRIHSREQVFKSFDLLRKAGFDNLNLDLMFAIPGQTMESWQATLREALALGSEHLSSYEVIYEEDTPLFHQLKAGEFDVDEDLACAMYEELVQQATHVGYRQYEIANFARDVRRGSPPSAGVPPPGELPAFACRHNVNYWSGGDFFGLGPGATTYVRGVRTKNVSNTRLYCERLEAGERPLEFREELSPLGRAGETAAFGLRMVAGWPFDEFTRVTGFDLRAEWAAEMRALVQQGNAEWDESGFRLTPRGLRFADAAAEMFLRSGDELASSAGKERA
ncbi:MAG TPA: radical SAM family heme chaperone HemW [Verrucomicrobiae bacterium]